jgi:flavin reductase (DIM6/NTAB) family NADH-FMN oxidoreductase RutF
MTDRGRVNLRGRLALFFGALPRWSAIALHDPQGEIAVSLQHRGATLDVTRNNEIAGLIPLTLAIGLELEGSATPSVLSFHDGTDGRTLGALQMKARPREADTPQGVTFFEVVAGHHSCLGWAGNRFDDWFRREDLRKSKNPHNFAMAPEATKWAAIFYLCPRAVYLVSAEHGERGNIFPMDQVGRMRGDGEVSLSLRNTHPSVQTIGESRRVVLSSIAAARKANAYELGQRHRIEKLDPAELPFPLALSPSFAMRHPANAVRVRELEITDIKTMGSHTFFIGRAISDRRLSDEPQLFHTPGFHQRYRTRRGRPFPQA